MSIRTLPLGEFLEIICNGTTTTQNTDGVGFPVSRIETIQNYEIVPERVRHIDKEAKNLEKWFLKKGDILLSHINSVEHIGKSAVYRGTPENFIHGMNLLMMRVDEKKILPDFLAYYLRSKPALLYFGTNCKRAVNQASINQQEIKKLAVPIFALPEQKRIVEILKRAEGIIRLRKEQLVKTRALIPALFIDMFGDPRTNKNDWKMVEFGTVVDLDAPMVDPKKDQYIDLVHIGPDRIEKEIGKLLPALTAREEGLVSGKYLFDETYVLYSKIRPYLRKAALPNFKGLCSADMYPVKPQAGKTTREYLFSLLLSDAFLAYTETLPGRASIPKLNRTELRAYKFPLPPYDEQKKYSQKIQEILPLIEQLETSIEKQQSLFQSLLHHAFQGTLTATAMQEQAA